MTFNLECHKKYICLSLISDVCEITFYEVKKYINDNEDHFMWIMRGAFRVSHVDDGECCM